MEPESGSRDVRMRTRVRVTARDVETSHSGIKIATMWIKVSYVTASGATAERYVIEAGDLSDGGGGVVVGNLRPGFEGKITGNSLDQTTGVTIHFVATGNWAPDTLFTVAAFAEDNEAPPNVNAISGTFRTDVPTCFEDDIPAPTATDTLLINGFPAYPNCDKLRQLIMQGCTTSKDSLVQARTLMHLATKTDMKTILAGLFDYSLVDDIKLCDRVPFLTLEQMLRRYNKIFLAAIDEVPSLTLEAKELIMSYYEGSSPVYMVNAVALVVLLTAVLDET